MAELKLKALCEELNKFNLDGTLKVIDPFKFDPNFMDPDPNNNTKDYFTNEAFLITFEGHKGALVINHEGVMWPAEGNFIYSWEVDVQTFVEDYLD